MITAHVVYVDDTTGQEDIELSTGHHIQFGGSAGGGYCYTHQDFDCLDALTKEERQAIEKAT